MTKKAYLTILTLIITALSIIQAQLLDPNHKISELIETKNYYELNTYYPTVKEKVTPLLQLLTEATTGARFNRYAESCIAIEKLMHKHFNELEPELYSELYSLLISNLVALEEYEQVINILKPLGSDPSTLQYIKYLQALASVPPIEIVVPNRDVILPITFEKQGKGEHIFVEAEMDGIIDKYIFDTGCSDFNFASEEFAKKHNLKIIFDSFEMSGVTGGTGFCKIAVGSDMKLGDIIIKNPLFLISSTELVPDNIKILLTDSIKIDAVLGTGILKKLKEVQIIPAKNQIIIPYEQSSIANNKQNLMLDGYYLLFLSINDKLSNLWFDTGNTKTNLNINYYNANKKYIDKKGKKHSGYIGGFAGSVAYDGYSIPKIPFQLDETSINLHDIPVELIEKDVNHQGSLGVDFIKAFNKITINFEKMFVVGS